MLSKDLEVTLNLAFKEARSKRHEWMTVEHLLLALLDNTVAVDVLKAVALGAKACLIGRAWAYALGAGGEAQVSRMLGTLKSELAVAMVLTGSANLRDAGRNLLDTDG